MPVFDLGYRRYEGRRAARALRFWPVARTSFRTARRWPFWVILGLGSIPLLIHLVYAYASGLTGENPLLRRAINPWGYGDGLFYGLLTKELFWVVLLLTVAGAGQIAEDLRSGAMQIYFSKPITQLDYVVGKLVAVTLATACLTILPGVVLFLGAAAFAPDWSFLTQNPFLLLKVAAFSLLVASVLGPAVLALSSLGTKGRMVGLVFAGAWFVTWILAQALSGILEDPAWTAVHVGACLEAAGRTFFSQGEIPDAPVGPAWIVLGTVTFVSILVFTRKVDRAEVVR